MSSIFTMLSERGPSGRPAAARRSRGFGKVGRSSLLAVLALAATVSLAQQMLGGPAESPSADPCEAPGSSQAVLLLDLRKPLAPAYATLPSQRFRDVASLLPARTELEVYALADYAEAPRLPLGKLCKPYGSEELAASTAKEQVTAERDCDDLPVQLPASLRDSARRFCAQREALAGRIDALADAHRNATVDSAYLVEALEDTAGDFERSEGPKSLYVFSDMMQHAEWFSHLDMAWNAWGFEAFSERRADRAAPVEPHSELDADVEVTIFYLPRKGATEHSRQRAVHQRFWQAYFNGAGEVAFHDQSPVLDYVGTSLMDVPSEAELVAQKRERVRYERVKLERLRTDLKERRERVTEELRELRREQERLREQQAVIASERDGSAVPPVAREFASG